MPSKAAGDYWVATDIRRFAYQVKEKRVAVDISVELMNDGDGRGVATRIFRSEVPVARDSAKATVIALDGALDKGLVGILRWAVGRVRVCPTDIGAMPLRHCCISRNDARGGEALEFIHADDKLVVWR